MLEVYLVPNSFLVRVRTMKSQERLYIRIQGTVGVAES